MRTEDLNIGGIELTVEYSYYKGEPQVMYYPDGSGYPGSPPEVEIEGIFIGDDQDVYDLLCGKYITEIEEKLIEINESW